MKIAVISDIHDNLVNLEKCLIWCRQQKIEALICCGDVANSETLAFLASNFTGFIYLAEGNVELYDEAEIRQFKNISYLGKFGVIELGGKKIGICHEPYLIANIMETDKCDIIFYGHTHKPWSENKYGVLLINPGTLGAVFQKATFAVWETEKKEPELKILEILQ